MARYRSGEIRIAVSDVIYEIDDDDLLDECRSRKLTPAAPGETVDMDIVCEAYDAIRRHALAEAQSILERILFPKWKSVKECDLQRTTTSPWMPRPEPPK